MTAAYRYIVVAELDPSQFDDARQREIALLAPDERAEQVRRALAQDVPNLGLISVTEVQQTDVVL